MPKIIFFTITLLYLFLHSGFALATNTEAANAKVNVITQVRPLIDKGIAAYEKCDYLIAIQNFLEAEEKASNTDDKLLLSEIYYDLGISFFQISSHGQSLDYFYRALKLCPKDPKNDERRYEILYGIAGVYFKDGDYGKAKELLVPFYKHSIAANDTASIVYVTGFLSMIARRQGDNREAAKMIEEAQRYIAGTESPDEGWVLTLESTVRYAEKDYARVEEIWNRLSKIKHVNISDKGLVAIYMGNILTSRKRFSEAEKMLSSASDMIILNDKPFYYTSLSYLHKERGNYPKALAFKDSVIMFKDSIEAVANSSLLDATRTQLEVLRFTEEMEENMAKLHRNNIILLVSAIAIVLLGLVVILLLRYRLMRSRSKSQMAAMQLELESEQRATAEERLKLAEMEAAMEQEKLRNSIEEQRLQLNASSSFITARNNLVQSLIDEIDKSGSAKKLPEIKSFYNRLRILATTSQKEYENLLFNFECANPAFFRRLGEMHPELTQSDLKFLALVRMNMSTKDISCILNINPESCKRRKIRISHKLGIDNSSNLFPYILEI